MQNVRVKICGVTRVDQAKAIGELRADAIGIVFYEPSPRAVMDFSKAAEIARAVGPFTNVFGLFVDPDMSMIEVVLNCVPLDGLQFHGNETAEFCASFNRPFIKAVRMKPGLNLDKHLEDYKASRGILLDTYVKGVPGGTGERFDWQAVPHDKDVPIILAGGLDADNVGSAIDTAKPYAVDVSGGVESAPGHKNLSKVEAFIKKVKSE